MPSSSEELGERRRRPRERELERRRLDERRRSLSARGAGLTRGPEARLCAAGRGRRVRYQALCCLAASAGPWCRLQILTVSIMRTANIVRLVLGRTSSTAPSARARGVQAGAWSVLPTYWRTLQCVTVDGQA